jgi:predicted glycosyltransferase
MRSVLPQKSVTGSRRERPSAGRGAGRALRVALFTHDTFGLGHVRRCLHLIHEISRREPDASILLVTGSPALHALRGLPRNADYLKIPTVARTGPEENRPPHLPLPTRETTSLRKRIVRTALDAFRPDVLLVDNFPLGSRKELLPTLERLRRIGIPTVLGLRDIVDLPEVVRRAWTKDGVYDVLERYYDRILVYGLPEVLDALDAYGLPPDVAARVRYCGYVTARDRPRTPPGEVRMEPAMTPPVVLGTVGGGGDGFPLLSAFVVAVRHLSLSAIAVTGPLMPSEERRKIRALAAGAQGIVVREYLPDLPSHMAAADLVVTMGGYNTTAELLALGRRAIVVPRNWRYGEHARGTSAGVEWEQVLRARALERLGLADVIDPERLDADILAARISAALARPAERVRVPLDVDGAARAVDRLFELVTTEAHHGET